MDIISSAASILWRYCGLSLGSSSHTTPLFGAFVTLFLYLSLPYDPATKLNVLLSGQTVLPSLLYRFSIILRSIRSAVWAELGSSNGEARFRCWRIAISWSSCWFWFEYLWYRAKKSGGKRVLAISWLKVAVAQKFGGCVAELVSSDNAEWTCTASRLVPSFIAMKQQHCVISVHSISAVMMFVMDVDVFTFLVTEEVQDGYRLLDKDCTMQIEQSPS